jgi:2-amino-4-hydroxy-6-hydroxymethyldihydropteridine diphosphokinase
MSRAVVSLGSNIEPRAEFLARALDALGALPSTRLVQASSVMETVPVDVPREFAGLLFLNQAAVFDTGLEVRDFARRMHAVEDGLGRTRTVRNGPRTIDIDLVDFDGMVLDEPDLTLPHPRAAERDFVVHPLAELGIFPERGRWRIGKPGNMEER